MQRNLNKDRLKALFDQIVADAPAGALNDKWLTTIHANAKSNERDWQTRLDAYLQGLCDSGTLSGGKLHDLRSLMSACNGPEPGVFDLISPIAWTVCAAVMTLGWQLKGRGKIEIAIAVIFAAVIGAFWAVRRTRCQTTSDQPQKRQHQRLFWIAFGALVAPAIAMYVSGLTGELAKAISIHQFKTAQAKFVADPAGFPMIRNFAKENFGIDVVLGDVDSGWSTTALALPGSSVATMTVYQGFCEMNLYREKLLLDFGPPSSASKVTWIQGVMLHELAHCLDGSRDLPTFGERRSIRTLSISPADAKHVVDIQSYVTAARTPGSMLWREALADIMAVGFWRLRFPGEANAMVTELRNKRVDAAGEDKTHATTCWIDLAAKARAPQSMGTMLEWADRLRASPECQIPPDRQSKAATPGKA